MKAIYPTHLCHEHSGQWKTTHKYKIEALAIVWGTQKFYVCFCGKHFKLKRDHVPYHNDSRQVKLFPMTRLEQVPFTAQQVRQASQHDKVLSRVHYHVLSTWSTCKQDERLTTVYQGIVVPYIRTVVLTNLSETILQDLHIGYQDTAKMKRLHTILYGSHLSLEIIHRRCSRCSRESNMPA